MKHESNGRRDFCRIGKHLDVRHHMYMCTSLVVFESIFSVFCGGDSLYGETSKLIRIFEIDLIISFNRPFLITYDHRLSK